MIDWIGALFRGLVSFVMAFRPRNLRQFASRVPLYGPLALRSMRRRPVRSLLVGLCLGAGIVVYLGLAGSFHGAAAEVAGGTANLAVPADVVVLGTKAPGAEPVEALRQVVTARSYEVFDHWRAETSLGTLPVVGLSDDGFLRAGLGDGAARPGPGQALVPASRAAAASLVPGGTVRVGSIGPAGYVGGSFTMAAAYDEAAAGDLFRGAIVLRLDDLLALRARVEAVTGLPPGESAASAGPNSVAIWQRDPGDRARLLDRVREMFPEATILWPEFPASAAYRAVGGFLSPGRIILALVFVMAGLGVFNVMLLSLLQRKVQMGVLKALGAEDEEVFQLLFLEGSLTAAGGVAVGLGGGVALVRLLDKASQISLALSASSLVWAVVLAVISFLLAAWLPATLCRRAQAIQLVSGRRLYLNPRSTCAQCGRCGGF